MRDVRELAVQATHVRLVGTWSCYAPICEQGSGDRQGLGQQSRPPRRSPRLPQAVAAAASGARRGTVGSFHSDREAAWCILRGGGVSVSHLSAAARLL